MSEDLFYANGDRYTRLPEQVYDFGPERPHELLHAIQILLTIIVVWGLIVIGLPNLIGAL